MAKAHILKMQRRKVAQMNLSSARAALFFSMLHICVAVSLYLYLCSCIFVSVSPSVAVSLAVSVPPVSVSAACVSFFNSPHILLFAYVCACQTRCFSSAHFPSFPTSTSSSPPPFGNSIFSRRLLCRLIANDFSLCRQS